MTTKPRRCALYARLSLATEESVSIDRQLEAGRRYAEARGWEVVLEAVDDGVSATRYAPPDRPGWQKILAAAPNLDAVVIWKVDRLARSVSDFVDADKALSADGCGIVAIEDPVDMTTPQGRAFAIMLAVFAELDAKIIGARVRAARTFILMNSTGRVVGGQRPWPFLAVDREDGAGKRWVPHPDRAPALLEAVDEIIAGGSISAVVTRWNAAGLLPDPKKRGGETRQTLWSINALGRLLRNPTLYGAQILHGTILRNADGTARIDESRALLPLAKWRRLQDALDRPGRVTRGGPAEVPLSLGLATCGRCERALRYVEPTGKLPVYRCTTPGCYTSVSARPFEDLVESTFLAELGPEPMVDLEEPAVDEAEMAEVMDALEAAEEALAATDDDDEALRLVRIRRDLRARLSDIQDAAPAADTLRALSPTGETYAEAWLADDADRPDLLRHAFSRIVVEPGQRGGRRPLDERITFER